MALIQINWKPGPSQLRRFGVIVLAGFGLLGALKCFWPWEWGLDRNQAFGLTCFAVAAVIGGLGLTGTRLALPFYWLWMAIAFMLGNVMSRLIFGAFFYGLVTPLGLLMRLTGRDRLRLRRHATDSYWRDVPPVKDKSRYERQF